MSGDGERQVLLTPSSMRNREAIDSTSTTGRAFTRYGGILVSALAVLSAGAAANTAKSGVFADIYSSAWLKLGGTRYVPGLGNAWGGEIIADRSVATLGTQPSVQLQSWDPAHIGTLRFNPCKSDDAEYEAMEWSTANVKPWCQVDALNCAFCAWVLRFDSEYRVNDIVTCLGPTYKIAAEAVVHDAQFAGTLLQRMLDAKGKTADAYINFYTDHFEEAQDNFRWMIEAVGNEDCDVPDHRTLIVHIRAGDNLNDSFKNIPHIQESIDEMTEYVQNRPYITRIEFSSVLHFGVPAPDAQFTYNDGVSDAYSMTDEALMKNGLILGHFYEAAKQTGRDVWFTSTNDPDQDICRYAKACHFLTASLSKEEMANEGPMEQRLSFSELVRDLHMHLSICDAYDKMEYAPETWGTVTAEIGERESETQTESPNSVLSRLLGFDKKINWRS